MKYFPLFDQVQTTDRLQQTESDAYEPSVHTHRCAEKWLSRTTFSDKKYPYTKSWAIFDGLLQEKVINTGVSVLTRDAGRVNF